MLVLVHLLVMLSDGEMKIYAHLCAKIGKQNQEVRFSNVYPLYFAPLLHVLFTSTLLH